MFFEATLNQSVSVTVSPLGTSRAHPASLSLTQTPRVSRHLAEPWRPPFAAASSQSFNLWFVETWKGLSCVRCDPQVLDFGSSLPHTPKAHGAARDTQLARQKQKVSHEMASLGV